MKAGPSQDFFQKESPLAEDEEDYTVDEGEQGNEEALVQPLLEGQLQEIPPLSGPLNRWRHSDLRTQSPLEDMTILLLTEDPLNQRARNLEMEPLRAAEKGLVDRDQHGLQGRINPLVLGA